MAISVTSLTSGQSTSNTTSYATASISPTAGRVVFVIVPGTGGASGTNWTVSGLSGTWNRFGGSFHSGANSKKYDGFWCTDFSGSGPLTLGNTASMTACLWSVFEVDGADTTTPVVTSNVVTGDSGTTNVASLSLTLAAAASSDNRSFGAFGDDDNTLADHVAGTNFTSIHTMGIGTPTQGGITEWRSDAFTTTVSASNSVGTNSFLFWGMAWEVAAAAAGGGSTTASAQNAASTVTANQPSPSVKASSNLSTVATSAPQPTSSIKGSANLVTVAATAYDATIKTESPTATPSKSTVGVNANNPSPSVAAKA